MKQTSELIEEYIATKSPDAKRKIINATGIKLLEKKYVAMNDGKVATVSCVPEITVENIRELPDYIMDEKVKEKISAAIRSKVNNLMKSGFFDIPGTTITKGIKIKL